jgi:hypothetical protein
LVVVPAERAEIAFIKTHRASIFLSNFPSRRHFKLAERVQLAVLAANDILRYGRARQMTFFATVKETTFALPEKEDGMLAALGEDDILCSAKKRVLASLANKEESSTRYAREDNDANCSA